MVSIPFFQSCPKISQWEALLHLLMSLAQSVRIAAKTQPMYGLFKPDTQEGLVECRVDPVACDLLQV